MRCSHLAPAPHGQFATEAPRAARRPLFPGLPPRAPVPELRPLCYHPAVRCALTLRQTYRGHPQTPFLEGQILAVKRPPHPPGVMQWEAAAANLEAHLPVPVLGPDLDRA